MKNCPKCKIEVGEDDLFCRKCGARLIENKRHVKSRGNGQGTVYRLPNGKWACEITKYINGERKRSRKQGFKTKKEAAMYIPQLQLNKKKKKTITIHEAYKALEPSISKLSDKRQKIYARAYSRLESVAMCNVSEFEIADLQNIIDDIDGGFYSKRYVKDLLNKIFEYAIMDGKADRNIVKYIVLPKNEDTSERAVFTKDEVNILWQKWSEGEEIAGLMLICLYCCLRTGELWSIQCETVNFETHTMYGGIKTKKGKYAPIFITSPIEPVIKYFVEKGNKHFYNDKPYMFYKAWNKFKKSVNFREELQPYCARHSCTSVLTEAGLPEAVIMQITRHTNYDTTLGYTHIDTNSILERMNDAVKNIK